MLKLNEVLPLEMVLEVELNHCQEIEILDGKI
jgi:hypothetical protein